MARTLGVDHGTRELRFCHLEGEEKKFLKIERERAVKTSILKSLQDKGFLDVDLIGLTYSMGDSIDAITNVSMVEGKGQLEQITGELVGGGTRLFDEVKTSKIKAVLIPGLHRGIRCLDERFRLLYSHMAASDKVALSYEAYFAANIESEVKSLVIADISSNTVTIGIKNGRFFGAVDACLGAPGLLHGPLDLEAIRSVDKEEKTANEAFYTAGVLRKIGKMPEELRSSCGEKSEIALKALVMASTMEVQGMSSIIDPGAIAIGGSAGTHPKVFSKLKKSLEKIAPVIKLEEDSGAMGAAKIARDILDREL